MINMNEYFEIFKTAVIYGIGFNATIGIFGYAIHNAIKLFKEASK
jgi:preprotein translocase subunit Sss1